MQIDKPEWVLKKKCPCCCEGEGSLLFIACPNCSHIALVCTEVGTVFPDVRNLAPDEALEEGDLCRNCRSKVFSEFINASSDQLIDAGISRNEYE